MDGFMTLLSDPATYVSLLTLTLMEIVLGIDNIIFISILSGKLPKEQQGRARVLGLGLALLFRIALLLCIAWIVKLVDPLFSILGHDVSGRDLILIAGGLFLIAKSTSEIHGKIEEAGHDKVISSSTFGKVLVQIVLLDIVFSFDSVITAVGLVQEISIMVVAILISLVVMLAFAKGISDFVNEHPTFKMLALTFLLMIGTMLLAEGWHFHVPKGYIYFAMAFSVFVEFLNMRVRASKA